MACALALSLLAVVPFSFALASSFTPVIGIAAVDPRVDPRVDLADQTGIVPKTINSREIEAFRRIPVQRIARVSLRLVPGHCGVLADKVENTTDSAVKFVALCSQATFNQAAFLGWVGRAPPLLIL